MIEGDKIVNATEPHITAQCLRVPVSDGHMAAVLRLLQGQEAVHRSRSRPIWAAFAGRRAGAEPAVSAPKQFLHYFEEPDRPADQARPHA